MIRLGISVYSVPQQNINLLYDFYKSVDLKAVELWDDNNLTNIKPCIINYFNKTDILISIHANQNINLGYERETNQNIKKLSNLISYSRKINAKKIIIHIGKGDSLKFVRQVITSIIPKLSESNIQICIENIGYLPQELMHNSYELIDFVDTFQSEFVNITFDSAHANLTTDINSLFDKLNKKVTHIHVSDNNKQHKNHHKYIGEGNIDFDFLKKVKKNTDIIIEVSPNKRWNVDLLRSIEKIKKYIN